MHNGGHPIRSSVARAVSQRVEVLGLDDKRQITALFGCNSSTKERQKPVILKSTSPKTGSLRTPLTIGRTRTQWYIESVCLQKRNMLKLPRAPS